MNEFMTYQEAKILIDKYKAELKNEYQKSDSYYNEKDYIINMLLNEIGFLCIINKDVKEYIEYKLTV
jgi:hypothetical protein